ncbi:hypothetical protein ACHAP3_011062 [Botrytis cinerea]
MRHQSDVWRAGEDWAGVSSAEQRRMLQNRLNQRVYRRRQKAKAAAATVNNAAKPHDSQEAEERLATQLQMVRHVAKQAHTEFLARNPHPERLVSVLQLNVFTALTRNAAMLGLDVGWLVCDAISPFGQTGPQLPSTPPKDGLYPDSLSPTSLQSSAVHHPWIDLLPWPELRDRILFLSINDRIDEDELWYDLVEFDTVRTRDEVSLIIWGEPWDPRGWEVSIGFLRKWGWLLKGSLDVLEGTNYWRHKRGERMLSVKML